MTIEKRSFGETKAGEKVDLFVLQDGEFVVEIITYGAAVRSINVPVAGGFRDVALGFDDIAGYETSKSCHGAVVGRYANRIAGARYEMTGEVYYLDVNNDPNCIHGGFVGFDKQVWVAEERSDALVLKLTDKEGTAAGFPGDLEATVIYTLSNGELCMEYIAVCNKDTPVNLTNHCYFNLAGHDSGGIENHRLQILSDRITAVDDTLIPTGELMNVSGTPLDLRELSLLGPGLERSCPQMDIGGGYDQNWVLSDDPYHEYAVAAVLECNGLRMTCLTTKPGVQFYSGNMMQPETGKGGASYSKRTGLCLETQYWPNSVNIPEFPAPLLEVGDLYNHKTGYKFEVI